MDSVVKIMDTLISTMKPEWISLCILLASFIALGIFLERAFYYWGKCRLNSKALLAEIRNMVMSDRIPEARKLCKRYKSPLAICLEAALWHFEQGLANDEIQNAVDEIALRELPVVQKRVHYLGLLGNVATLLGLLGTILGLIQCFAALADAIPSEKGKLLSRGIAVAMNTTAQGLIIGIACMSGYSFLSAKSNEIIESVDEGAVRMLNFLFAQRAAR